VRDLNHKLLALKKTVHNKLADADSAGRDGFVRHWRREEKRLKEKVMIKQKVIKERVKKMILLLL